jgi:outer membrane protein TolC
MGNHLTPDQASTTMTQRAFAACIALAFVATPAPAAETAPASLPDPLTLEHALTFADAGHPELEQAYAEQDLAVARLLGAESGSGLVIAAQARARYIEPSDLSTDRSHDDNIASLLVRKRLYDFGRSGGAEAAATSDVKSQEVNVRIARTARRLDIMSRFFDVVVADLRATRDNEAMTVAYLRYDRLRTRLGLGQSSEIDVAELNARYHELRRVWYESTAEQRNSRARLAQAMRWTGSLPSNLKQPVLEQPLQQLPSLDQMQAAALEASPPVLAARERVTAQVERVRSARAGYWPTLDAEFEAFEYSRDLSSRDKWRAGLVLDIPIYNGGKVSADVAQATAELRRANGVLGQRESEVRTAVAELYNRLTFLRAQRDEAKVLSDYRELYLDRARMIYQQEVRTDLGDSMAQASAAKLRSAETEYAIAMALARLEALVGKPLQEFMGGNAR